MKRIFKYQTSLCFLLVIFISSCTKQNVSVPDFDVQITATTVKAGQPVNFSFAGNADYITFWSGEKGRNYNNRNRSAEQGVAQTLKFTSLASTSSQTGNVKLLISTDFDGMYTAADIANATWTDISSRAILSTGTSVSSGSVDISDIGTLKKPCYIGFYYYAPQNTVKPATWTISAPTVTNTLADGTVSTVIANLGAAGFQGVDLQNPAKAWTIGTTMVINGGAAGDPVNEDWAISAPIDLTVVSAPDFGVGIKPLDALLPSYTYTFANPGTYSVTFVATNANSKSMSTIVKQLTITVTP